MKRVMPAPMGRAFRIRKRSNHVTIVVAQRKEAKLTTPKKKIVAGSKKTEVKTTKKQKTEAIKEKKKVTES
jgi:large subunit ribosomal protein L22